ncbi:small ribosomal subunit protein bS21c-like [Typha latifolia]|uniref:small ribosomal subunit protein bS21c-like n=1 Tax=Typha latifolia TaxID=4733 RepID=UPI003C2C68AD
MATSSNLLHLHLPFAKPPPLPSLRPSRLSHLPVPSCLSSSSTSLSAASVDPALRHANVLFYKSGYNVQILVDDDESEEALLRRFRREVSKAGVIQECKRRRFFENKQEEHKRKVREAGRRNRRRWSSSGPRFSPSSTTDGEAPKRASDDLDDNWDMPEGDLPY